MATEVVVPKLGFAMSEGQLAEWLVRDGESVTAGQSL
jgi:pyruvate/2-oxoglutarate dehydrogenase complex dihydrolipoamide acyltransferase (E2) component